MRNIDKGQAPKCNKRRRAGIKINISKSSEGSAHNKWCHQYPINGGQLIANIRIIILIILTHNPLQI